MKAAPPGAHSVERAPTVPSALEVNSPAERAASLDLHAVYEAHGDFVWASLQRLGVRAAELEDQFQEVFIVVHRKFATYDPQASLRSWLYGICVRVASTHRT